MEKIELSRLPRELRRAVEGEIKHDGAKLLGCTMHQSTPYLDKSVVLTIYKAYTELLGSLTVYSTGFGGGPSDLVLRDQ